jgi:predicted nucleotidyltransferase component of viral defense system
MLHYRTVYSETLELLKMLMQNPRLHQFYLVGGTALALQLGHRISIDLDLFTNEDFNTADVVESLRNDFELQLMMQKEKNSLIINARAHNTQHEYIKIDFIKYPYPLISSIQEVDTIRLLSPDDIIPMKLSAVANRGAKKDFYDIYELMKYFSLATMLQLFSKKYPDIAHFHILKSLVYFDDAEDQFDPVSLNDTNWQLVKSSIEQKVNNYT